MRVVHKAGDLDALLDEAQGEAERAFGNPAVFLEKYIPRAKHIEVQILGDQHGNVLHLHERDCSVQRRHQKVVEIAPSVGLDDQRAPRACATRPRASRRRSATTTPARSSSSTISIRNEWFFIEMNPRIQVEHTVTEVITGIDLVRAQILIAQGARAARPGARPAGAGRRAAQRLRGAVPHHHRGSGEQVHAGLRQDPHLSARAGGFGMRLDGGMGDAGAVITPFYDSLLVKVTASGQTFDMALRAHGSRAARVPHPRREDEHPVPRKRHRTPETSAAGQATTTLIDTTPELFKFKPRRDRATKLLSFLGDVIVNGNPHAKGYKPASAARSPRRCPLRSQADAAAGHAPAAARARAEEIRRVDAASRSGCSSPTRRSAMRTSRCMATRVRSYDMLAIADAVARRTPELFSLEMWGGATFDTAMRFLNEDPWERLRAAAREACRTSVSRCCCAARTRWATRTIPTMSSPVS